jgi:hypothetical protein
VEILVKEPRSETRGLSPCFAAAAKGIISGYPDGSFKPQANASRAEAATMIIKALGK